MKIELTVSRAVKLLETSSVTYRQRQQALEGLLNLQISNRLLVGLEIILKCPQVGIQDNVQVKRCHQGRERIVCHLESHRAGTGAF